MGSQFGQTPNTATAMNRFTAMLAGASKEPKVIGAAFSLPSGALSEPIEGNTGVYVLKATSTTTSEALPSYAGYKSSLLNSAQQNLQQELTSAVKSTYTIVDNRNLYY